MTAESINCSSTESKIISFLRFPLIVGVVLIHSWLPKLGEQELIVFHTFRGQAVIDSTPYPVYSQFCYLFSEVVPRIAVPLFFLTSGFLFFYNKRTFNFNDYVEKLNRRRRTILYPYILWNIIYFIYNAATQFLIFHSADISFNNFILGFWALPETDCPSCFPFWFLRDLMVVFLLTPFIFILIKRIKYWILVILGGCWFLGITSGITGLNVSAIFFFTSGAYFSINNISFKFKHSYVTFALYVISVIILLTTNKYDWSIYILNVSILLGICCTFNIAHHLCSNPGFRTDTLLSASSFFVFCYHIIAIGVIKFFITRYTAPASTVSLLFTYMFIPALSIVLGVYIYKFLKMFFPRLITIITGR